MAASSMIQRGGQAYEEIEDGTDMGGVVGATVGLRLGSMLSFYVAAEDYIYGTQDRRDRARRRFGDPERRPDRDRLRLSGRALSLDDLVERVPAVKLWLRQHSCGGHVRLGWILAAALICSAGNGGRAEARDPRHLEVRSQAGRQDKQERRGR